MIKNRKATMHTEVQSQEQHQSPFEYEQLIGHERTDGIYKTDQQLRMEYIQRTDELIYKMTDGVEVKDPLTGEKTKEVPDVVIWLDKSARPLAWFTKQLWPKLAPAPGSNEVPKMPDFKFVNIDREQWVSTLDPRDEGIHDINRVDESIIRSLRSIFVSPKYKDIEAGLSEDIDTMPSELDNKTILIIDEVYASGRTLDIADKFFQQAFPTSKIATTHWMRGITMRQGAIGNKDLPVWYSRTSVYGRGVSDRDVSLSGQSENSTQKLGAWFLSRRHRPKHNLETTEKDTQAVRLRKELGHLATSPDVPILPSFSRADAEKRMAVLNGMPFEKVKAWMMDIKQQTRHLS